MNKIKEYWGIILVIIFTNLFCILLFSFIVFADDYTGADNALNLNMCIEYKGQNIEKSEDNIYYFNDAVRVVFPEYINNNEDEINDLIEELKGENDGREPEIKVERYFGKSVWNGDAFADFEEMSEAEVALFPEEGDIYNRKAVKFKCIKSYRMYYGEALVKAANITYLSPAYQFVFDKTSPEIARIDENDYSKQIVEGSASCFKIKDGTGIKSIDLIRNGKSIDTVNISPGKRMVEYEYETYLVKENSDADELKIIAVDLSGNTAELVMNYIIDDTAPDISVMGEDGYNSLSDGVIFKDACSIKVKSSDNGGRCNVFYKCVYSDGKGNTTCLENYTKTFDGLAEIERSYSEEGVYDIISFSYDDSGNYSDSIRLSFGIDKAAPYVSLDNVENRKIYNAPVSMYATLKELFFENVNAEIEAIISDNNGERKLNISPFMVAAKVNRNVYTFAGDGTYKVKFSASDSMGRRSDTMCEFTIDRTPPLVEILRNDNTDDHDITANLKEGETIICNSRPSFNIQTSDNLSEYEVAAVLYRKESDGSFREESTEKIISVGKKASFPIEVKREGEYLLKISAVDAALNSKEKSISFLVDEEPPVIGYIDAFNEKYLKSFKLPDTMKDYISDATKVKYKAYLNSKEVSSLELNKDGKYILQIVAEDEAGNMSEKMAAFIVDNTSPKVIVHGIESGGNVKKDGIVNLTLFDDNDFFKSVSVNGKAVNISDRRKVNIKADTYGDYDISVVAADYAGNEITEVVKMKCALSDNPFKVTIDESDIKTLTKTENIAGDSIFKKPWFKVTVILCILAITLIAGSLIVLKISGNDTAKVR